MENSSPLMCPNCGANVIANANGTEFKCEFCGSVAALPHAPIMAEPADVEQSVYESPPDRRKPSRRWNELIEFIELFGGAIGGILFVFGFFFIMGSFAVGDIGWWQKEYGFIVGMFIMFLAGLLRVKAKH